jgi:hypothetical protein
MARAQITHPELPLIFGEGFLQDHAGHIISEPHIALVELVANAYDAGATRVDVHWPSDLKERFSISDNGSGMTREEFEKRWKTLCYNRLNEQVSAASGPNKTVKNRRAFGRSGKGRHGAFCFADSYTVESCKDGSAFRMRVERTNGGVAPFQCVLEAESAKEGHGTEIRALVTKNLVSDIDVRELLGSKFAVDPSFEIFLNGGLVKLLELDALHSVDVDVPEFGNVRVHRIDSELQDRTSQLRGITWWVNRRMVGSPSWEGLDGEGAYLDGRTSLAKRYSFVIEADILEKQVKADWTGFRAGARFNAVRDAVHREVVASLNEIQATSRKERKRAALAQTRENLRDLPVIAQNTVATFVEQVQEKCPTLSERDLYRTADIFAKMERARSGFDLLKQIQECSPDDIDTWNAIMQKWTASNAELVLNELGQRLRLIERLQQLVVSVNTDELHDLQPLFERGLWMFGPEYDAVDFYSNQYLATIVSQSLGGEEEQLLNRRPDFVALPGRSIGVYSAGAYDDAGEVSSIKQILVIELKKGGSELTQKELDQARDYAKELYKSADVKAHTKSVVYVLGATNEERLGEATYNDGAIKVIPMLYGTLLDRAHSRTFNLQRRLEQAGFAKPVDEEVTEVLAYPEDQDLVGLGIAAK